LQIVEKYSSPGYLRQAHKGDFSKKNIETSRRTPGTHCVRRGISLEHFAFETLRSALTAKMNFACASRAGGDAPRRRQSIAF
jgi:hypothetical protein